MLCIVSATNERIKGGKKREEQMSPRRRGCQIDDKFQLFRVPYTVPGWGWALHWVWIQCFLLFVHLRVFFAVVLFCFVGFNFSFVMFCFYSVFFCVYLFCSAKLVPWFVVFFYFCYDEIGRHCGFWPA